MSVPTILVLCLSLASLLFSAWAFIVSLRDGGDE